MTENKDIMSTLHSVSSLLPITLADGSISYTEGEGATNATESFITIICLLCSKIFVQFIIS